MHEKHRPLDGATKTALPPFNPVISPASHTVRQASEQRHDLKGKKVKKSISVTG